jgi:hypothetical protein
MGYQGDVFARQQQANKYAESCGKKSAQTTRVPKRSQQIKRSTNIREQTNSFSGVLKDKSNSNSNEINYHQLNQHNYPLEFVGLPSFDD